MPCAAIAATTGTDPPTRARIGATPEHLLERLPSQDDRGSFGRNERRLGLGLERDLDLRALRRRLPQQALERRAHLARPLARRDPDRDIRPCFGREDGLDEIRGTARRVRARPRRARAQVRM